MPAHVSHRFGLRRLALGLGLGLAAAMPVQAQDLSYLQGLLAGTPEGGWVQANLNSFASSVASQAEGGLPPGSYSDPGAIVRAWSSFAWDPNRAQLYLFGGGHASYMGNEIYVWSGETGLWSRGSLPSRLESGGNSIFYVVDDAAPQSAHTYDNQLFLPVSDRFISFGGATFNTGGGWLTRDGNGAPVGAGPWIWDPSKADPNKVGGTTGSGYILSIEGGEMWQNRAPFTSGTRGGSPLEGSTAYRLENGRDVVYMTRDNNASGFPRLYRFELGDPATGQLDTWQIVGRATEGSSSQTAAAIDTTHNLYVQIGNRENTVADFGFSVWDLDLTNAAAPPGNRFISLFTPEGQRLYTNRDMGIGYDEENERFVLWDGKNRGLVYYVEPAFDASGNLLSNWTIEVVSSTSLSEPMGSFYNGVLGKWHYISELGAFIAMDEFRTGSSAAEIWLYKPIVSAVPEPHAVAMFLAGVALVGWQARRRRLVSPTSLAA